MQEFKKKISEYTGHIKRVLRMRAAKCFGAGALLGMVAGAFVVFMCAWRVIAGNETVYTAAGAQLTEENDELRKQLTEYDAVEKNEETLSGESMVSDAWQLVLVNEEHPLDASYTPGELEEIAPGYAVDARIIGDLKAMMDDGAAQGLSMYVTSAYRSYDQQIDTFNASMQSRMDQGMEPLEAYQQTGMAVALPGTSEHATGLAVDIISNEYGALDERQGDTKEQQWLMAHCQEYGFILRYPSDKSDITGIIYEPWHYRYVGKDAAAKIMEQRITLEEYLGQ